MRKAVALLATAVALSGSPAHAAATFEFLFDGGSPLCVSTDGKVISGISSADSNEALRWTQAGGLVTLGRPQRLGGGGRPGMSADGTRIAFGIGSLDGTYTTQGLWTLGSGWQELMPPAPPDGGTTDGSYGSVWGLSGNGQVAVGLYWRPGQGNRAHASKWTQATGVVDLGGTLTGQASRANAVNHDGSVIAGWVETPQGPWRPAAWVDGSLVLLTNYDSATIAGSGEAKFVNSSGDIISGFVRDPVSDQRAAAMWKRADGVFGPPQVLGWLDGSEPGGYGLNITNAVSYDGHIAVGYCSFDGSPFGTTGSVWTPAGGLVDVNVFLANHGVLVDPNFTIHTMTTMTPDGRQLFGFGQMLTPPYTYRAFRITLDVTAGVTGPAAPAVMLAVPQPNPSSAMTRLEFSLSSAAKAELVVFDAAGRRVATLVDGELPSGRHSATWDGRAAGGERVAAGLYFARLITPQGAVSRRIVRSN